MVLAITDVTVMGAGIFGLSIAYACARRGASVAIVDPHGAGRGSSAGLVGALAPHTPERWEPKKEFQFDSLLMAEEFWSGVDTLSGLSSGYGRVGRLQPIANNRTLKLAQERIEQAKEFWKGKAGWMVCPVSDFRGWVPPSPTGLVVYDTLSARLDPRRACESLVAALETFGVPVNTSSSEKGKVVWATGYKGLLELSAEFAQEVGNGVKGQSILLESDRSSHPQIFVDGIHFVPHDNGTLAVGSTSERYFNDPESTDDQLDRLLDRALKIMPQLGNPVVLKRWAGVRPRAKTRAPMMGEYPGRPGHFIANGGFKIGFGMAPKVADIMSDLILDNKDTIPDEFRVSANIK